MKIAICFSGLMRTYRETYQNYVDSILKPNAHHEIDTFISTWTIEQSNNSMEWARRQAWFGDEARPFPENAINYHQIQEYYKPTALEVEKPIVFHTDWYIDTPGCHPQSLSSMWYKIMMADRLRQQYEKLMRIRYDAVIRIRFDTMMPFVLEVDKLYLDSLYIPSMMQPPLFPDLEWANDKFAVGNSELMTKYADWFNCVPALVAAGVPIQPEVLLAAHLKGQNAPYTPWGCEMELIRPAGF
jgi:hypothetical protein